MRKDSKQRKSNQILKHRVLARVVALQLQEVQAGEIVQTGGSVRDISDTNAEMDFSE